MRGRWCVAVLVLGIAHAQGQDAGRVKQMALGQRLAQEFRRKTTPVESAAVSQYVQRVGARLAAQFPGGWTYHIETVREDQGGATHEPAAFPGGYIFVPAALIATARNEAEFAGMLAHAMAHVVAGAPGMAGNAAGLGVPVGVLGLQRANESEADALAIKAMAAAGYDPAGLASYLRRVQPARPKDVSAVFAVLPPRDERVAAIEAEIRQLPARTYHAGLEFPLVQSEVRVPLAERPAPTLFRK